MESKHIACNLSGKALESFEEIRLKLSHDGSMIISDANVIRYLVDYHKQYKGLYN